MLRSKKEENVTLNSSISTHARIKKRKRTRDTKEIHIKRRDTDRLKNIKS